MTCNQCEHCTELAEPTFSRTMNAAQRAVEYIAEFEGHPQRERVIYPNRVAVDDYYMGFDAKGIMVYYYKDMDGNPGIYVNNHSLSVFDADAPPPIMSSEKLLELATNFEKLLKEEFFQG